jgi:choline kinase
MRAVILAAGVSRRLRPLTASRPKCLLPVDEHTILDHQMRALKAVGIGEACLVLGYRREQILEHLAAHHPDVRVTPIVNHDFFDTNTAHSLWLARSYMACGDVVCLNGDVLFPPRLLQRVALAGHEGSLAVETKRCGDEEVKVTCDEAHRIVRIGKRVPATEARGEFIGVARLRGRFLAQFVRALDRLVLAGHTDAYFEAAMDQMLDEAAGHAVDVTDLPSIEIDFLEDYERACREVIERFEVAPAGSARAVAGGGPSALSGRALG